MAVVDNPSGFHQAHDALFRAAFGAPERAACLLRQCLPADIVASIDWQSLQVAEGTFVDADLRRQHTDLLFSCRARARRVLLYVLVEHKAGSDRFTPLQLLRYVVRIRERHRALHPDERLLPPVLPLVLHHGSSAWTGPRTLHDLLDLQCLPTGFADLQPRCAFVLEDLGDARADDLRQRFAEPGALLTLLHLQQLRRVPDTARLLLSWRELFQHVAEDPGATQLLQQLVSYVAAESDDDPHAVRAAYAQIHHRTEERYMPIADKLRQEGRVEGHVEGLRNALRLQLEARFAPLPNEVLVRLTAAGEGDLQRWLCRVLTAASVDDVIS